MRSVKMGGREGGEHTRERWRREGEMEREIVGGGGGEKEKQNQ